jgi:hypothetical protein
LMYYDIWLDSIIILFKHARNYSCTLIYYCQLIT